MKYLQHLSVILAFGLLSACDGGRVDDGGSSSPGSLSKLVLQQCQSQPEDREPLKINDLQDFQSGEDYSNCL